MATTPHVDPPKKPPTDDKNDKAKSEDKAAAAPRDESPKPPTLSAEAAWSLFYNGHRIAKQGDPPTKWVSMSRAGDGVATVTSPMTPELEASVRSGQWYLIDDQGAYTNVPPTPPPPGLPEVVDTPYVSAMGAVASCTMGNWKNEPTAYAYAWQRDGTPISGATLADYTMVAADKGKQIGCIVSASNATGGPVAAPLSNTVVGP